MMICKLISSDLTIPNHEIGENQIFFIGRNRECKIKNLKCSRNYCSVQLKQNKLLVNYLKDEKFELLSSGDLIQGPGFSYKVKITDQKYSSTKTEFSKESNIVWSEDKTGSVLIGKYLDGGEPCSRIAAFDYDYTLVKTKSGKAFPINQDDWNLFDPNLPKLILKLYNEGYRFVIISNQLGLSKGKTDITELKTRFNDSLKKISVPCIVLIAAKDDIYRKPRIGLWDYFCDTFQSGVTVDYKKSFFVGDAAGRKKSKMHKGDHSFADLYFANNCGLNFMVPEKFIICAQSDEMKVSNMCSSLLPKTNWKTDLQQFNTGYILIDGKNDDKIKDIKTILPDANHCIIMCGISASGKTTFYRNHLLPLNYVHVNMDTLKSMEKCMSLAKKCFATSQNCVIDNTNVDKVTRSKWINICKQNDVIPIVFYFHITLEHIFHNNKYRKINPTATVAAVTDVVIYGQNKKLEIPTVEECGLLYTVNFVPVFHNDCDQRLYSMYLNDK